MIPLAALRQRPTGCWMQQGRRRTSQQRHQRLRAAQSSLAPELRPKRKNQHRRPQQEPTLHLQRRQQPEQAEQSRQAGQRLQSPAVLASQRHHRRPAVALQKRHCRQQQHRSGKGDRQGCLKHHNDAQLHEHLGSRPGRVLLNDLPTTKETTAHVSECLPRQQQH